MIKDRTARAIRSLLANFEILSALPLVRPSAVRLLRAANGTVLSHEALIRWRAQESDYSSSYITVISLRAHHKHKRVDESADEMAAPTQRLRAPASAARDRLAREWRFRVSGRELRADVAQHPHSRQQPNPSRVTARGRETSRAGYPAFDLYHQS